LDEWDGYFPNTETGKSRWDERGEDGDGRHEGDTLEKESLMLLRQLAQMAVPSL
jgi:hypothetical protein